MPYISGDRRKVLGASDGAGPQTAGELNYMITTLVVNYWLHTGNYQGINDILGALEGAKAEFYRRVVVPYENTKRIANGDVYPPT